MTPDEITKAAMALDWSLIVGVAMSILYLLLGMWMLLKKPPETPRGKEPDPRVEFYRTWRPPIIGMVFTILGCWAASGITGISSGFAWWSMFILVVYGAWRLYRKAHGWFRQMPLVGQTYHLKGIGEVTTVQVAGDTPLDARVQYKDASDRLVTVNGIQFQVQGRLLEDREVQPEPEQIDGVG